MRKKSVLSQLFYYMGPFKITQLISAILVAIGAVVSLYAYVSVYHVASIIIQSMGTIGTIDRSELVTEGVNAVLMIINGYALYGVGLFFSHITAFHTVVRIKKKIILHINQLPLGFHSMNSSGKVRKIIETNTGNLENLIAHQIPDTIQSITMPIAFLFFMFKYDWRLSMSCIIPIVIGFALLAFMLKDSSKSFVEKQQISAENISNAATEYVRGICVVKAFASSASSFKRYTDAIRQYQTWMTKFALSMKTADSAYNTIINGSFLFLIPIGIIIYNGTQSVEKLIMSFVFFCVLTPLTVTILMRIMNSSNNLMLSESSLKAINDILEEKPLPQSQHTKTVNRFDIAFENVTFRYSDNTPDVLKNICVTFPQGKITALVGASGGGKSTITNLIARFWDVNNGRITIDGRDLKGIDYSWWMNQVSIVFQETNLFKMSIADNVAFLCENVSRKEIKQALHLAQCDHIIERLPNGIDTMYGAKGVYLSGGEMQRIAIARAILKNSPVVLLDEATAFADSENEYFIQKALNELLKGKTVIMIAHRLSTVTKADQIIVIDEGEVLEQGTHEELMCLEQAYNKMYKEYESSVSWRIGGNRNV